MKINIHILLFVLALIPASGSTQTRLSTASRKIQPLNLRDVEIKDSFWSPKFAIWDRKTVYDVFDKLEGKYKPDRQDLIDDLAKRGTTLNAFRNFDLVAEGKVNIHVHDGPPWYDGLVYETIRGAADLLISYPDARLEQKIDGYIDRIAAAQAVDPDGYINTYTTLDRPDQRWGLHGGEERWQHDLYNAGMLMEAGVHYYQATGKTKLLNAAAKMSNFMCREMGPAPKKNIIPGHAGPEEALMKMYQLFVRVPGLRNKMTVAVNPQEYYNLAKFWIDGRGHYQNSDGSERVTYGAYNQDHKPVFEQKSLEGHAVRATLLAVSVAEMAMESGSPKYAETADEYWNNMIGKRMFITGGQGAIAEDEKFGPDYFLPESSYLETCASVGSAFFSQKMNELRADGKYMDEFERVIYNNMLSSVALDGQHYHYENPLIASAHPRWSWHSCPCCPPMFLKMVGALPAFIYGQDSQSVFVNLFIGSKAHIKLKNTSLKIEQHTNYPWDGKVILKVDPKRSGTFALNIRIPGWSIGKENPFDLYYAQVSGSPTVLVNGKHVDLRSVNGYMTITRRWNAGDRVELQLPMKPRLVRPNEQVKNIANKVAVAMGPLVYGLEGNDNSTQTEDAQLVPAGALKSEFKPELMGGINVITGNLTGEGGRNIEFRAIPFYAIGNRGTFHYRVWMKDK